MPYIKLVKAKDTPEFIAAVTTWGWDETNYKEVLDAITGSGCDDCYIIDYSTPTREDPPPGRTGSVSLFVTLGEVIGNKWVMVGPTDVLIGDQGVWHKIPLHRGSNS